MSDKKLATFSNCRKLYKDIIKGYSHIRSHDIYIKHFKEIDIGEINEIKEEIILDCKEKGLLSEKEKIEILIESELWTKKQEQEIRSLTEQIDDQRQAKTKLFIKAQLNAVQGVIDKKSKQLSKLITERDSLVGLTVEKFSEKKSSEQIIRLALFNDKKFKKPLQLVQLKNPFR